MKTKTAKLILILIAFSLLGLIYSAVYLDGPNIFNLVSWQIGIVIRLVIKLALFLFFLVLVIIMWKKSSIVKKKTRTKSLKEALWLKGCLIPIIMITLIGIPVIYFFTFLNLISDLTTGPITVTSNRWVTKWEFHTRTPDSYYLKILDDPQLADKYFYLSRTNYNLLNCEGINQNPCHNKVTFSYLPKTGEVVVIDQIMMIN